MFGGACEAGGPMLGWMHLSIVVWSNVEGNSKPQQQRSIYRFKNVKLTCNLIWCCGTTLATAGSRWQHSWWLRAVKKGSTGGGRRAAAQVAAVAAEVAAVIIATGACTGSSTASAPTRSSCLRAREAEEPRAGRPRPAASSTMPILCRETPHHQRQTFPARRSNSWSI